MRIKCSPSRRTALLCLGDVVLIDVRVADVECNGAQKRFGDFEMDLIADGHNHIILTIVERATNMLFITKLAHKKKAEPLVKAVKHLLLPTRNTSIP